LPSLGLFKQVLFSSFYGSLHISSLPSIKDLDVWQHNGICHLLNVSGINIHDMYSVKVLAPFDITQMTFADVFTKGEIINADAVIEAVSSDVYLQLTTEAEQQALLTAVQTLVEQLKRRTSTCVFCHRGQGRSPLVVAAAVQQFYRESIADAIARTRIIRPPALFTDISLSALQWCIEQQPKS
jgi:predicted protein tyrosine phosphatase